MPTGQSKTDPVSGVAGDIWNAYLADSPDNGLDAEAETSGSTARKMAGALIQAIAAAIVAGGGGGTAPWPVQNKSSNFTAAPWTHYAVDTSGGDVTVTLPAASTWTGEEMRIVKVSSDAHHLILGGTVNGQVNPQVKAQWSAFWLASDGTRIVVV